MNPREKKQVRLLSAVISICGVILLFQIYLIMTVAVPQDGGEYSEGLIGSPRFLNPILAQADADSDLSSLIFSGLLRRDKNQQLVPDLAERYEISDDQLTYTFYLRKDVIWHDGEPFKADDAIFTIASIQDPQFKSPLARSFRGVAAEKIDDYAIKITLKEPFAPFLGLMTFGVLPEHLWYSIPPQNADLTELNKKPIGTGPWKFDSFKKDRDGIIKSYVFLKNEKFYGAKPHLQKLIFKFYGDFVSAIDALKSKNIDGIAYLPKEYKPGLKKYKNINYYNLSQPQYTAIFFNQRKNELLTADYLREALALAVDKQKIVREAFDFEAQVIDAPSLPGIETNPNIKKYNYQPLEAIAILEKNGWQMVSTTTAEGITEQLRKKKEWYLTITLTTVNQPENIKIAEIIKQAWDQIGVKTTLNIVEKEKINKEVINARNYEALLFGENLGGDPDPFPFWHSSQNEYPGLNLAIFTNTKADDLLEKARKTNNWTDRQTYYQEFQKIIAETLPAIFLYNPTFTYPQDNQIKGFDVLGISAASGRFANLNEWYVKTKRNWK